MAITIGEVKGTLGGVQSAYPLQIGEGRLGLIYDLTYYTSYSYINGSGGVIPFGTPVEYDTTAEDKVVPMDAGKFAGVAAISETFVPGYVDATVDSQTVNLPGYPDSYTLNVLRNGTIWVLAGDDVTQGQTAAVLAGSVAFFPTGFAASVDIGATFLRSATAGQLVPMELNFA